MNKAAPDSNEETQQDRNFRKLSMIVGDANGTPTRRCVQRLSLMVPKQLSIGGEIPADVLEFVAKHNLKDLIDEKSETKKTKGKNSDG